MWLKAAQGLLESSDLPVSQIALRCGFGDDKRLRRAFIRALKVSPARTANGFAARAFLGQIEPL